MASDISVENGKTLGSEQDRKKEKSDLIFGWVVRWVTRLGQGSGEGLRSNKLSKIRVDLGGVKWVEMGK